MSPRAAWRLETLGFGEVYDYVGSKMEWIGAGLPWEGEDTAVPALGDVADPGAPTCTGHETVGELRARMGEWPLCLVVNEERVVLGLVVAGALGDDDGRPVAEVVQEGPSTYRPHVPASEIAPRLDSRAQPWVVVTTLDGRLAGIARDEDVRRAAKR